MPAATFAAFFRFLFRSSGISRSVAYAGGEALPRGSPAAGRRDGRGRTPGPATDDPRAGGTPATPPPSGPAPANPRPGAKTRRFLATVLRPGIKRPPATARGTLRTPSASPGPARGE